MALRASDPAHHNATGDSLFRVSLRDVPDRWAPGLVLATVGAMLLVQGFEFPNYNNIHHVPIVLGYAQSAEGPHDMFHRTLTHFTSLLWPLLSLVATERNVSWLFFAVYALNRAVLVAALYLIACELLPTCRRSVIALALSTAILLWWPVWALSPLGGNDLFVRSLSQTQLAVTALAICLWTMLRRRWLAAAACLGVAFNFNAFMALWGGVIAFAVYVRRHRAAPPRLLLRNLTILGATAAIAALPTAIWIARTIGSGPPAAPFDYRAYIREFYPRHNLLDGNWSGVLIAAMVAGIVWNYLRGHFPVASARTRDTVVTSFAAVCGIVVLGMAMPYAVNSRLLYCLFPLRMDGYLVLPLMTALMAAALARAYETADDATFWTDALVLVAFAGGNLPLALFASASRDEARTSRLVAGALLLLAAAIVIATQTVPIYERPPPVKAGALALSQVAVVAIGTRGAPPLTFLTALALIVPAVLPDPLAPWTQGSIALIYAGAAASVAGRGHPRRRDGAPPRLPSLRLIRTCAAPAILTAASVAGIGRVLETGTINYLPASERAKVAAERWLRDHSPPDSRVLALHVDGFSTLSRRPVWVDSQMGAAVMWAPSYYPTWHRRMAEIDRLHDIRAALDYARVHHIPYIVAPRSFGGPSARDVAGATILYRNPYYIIWSVGPRTPPPRAAEGYRRAAGGRLRVPGAQPRLRSRPPTRSSLVRLQQDNDVGRLRLVRGETRAIVIHPARQTHDAGLVVAELIRPRDFHDLQAVAVDEERVVAIDPRELHHDRMILRNRLGADLIGSAFDLLGGKLHCGLLSASNPWAMPPIGGTPAARLPDPGEPTVRLNPMNTRHDAAFPKNVARRAA